MKWLKQRDIIDESIDWAGALVFQALHDMNFKFRFGEKRLEKIGDDIDDVKRYKATIRLMYSEFFNNKNKERIYFAEIMKGRKYE